MMKIRDEYLKKELEDIINCIVKFDHTETLEVKGRYFDIIQKDLKQLVKNNGVLDYVIKQSEQLTFECEWCEDTGVMITGMDCTCDKAPSKS